ncbi:Hpt domain-containing protein [Pirellulaceae bacterium SH467]
MQSTANHHDLPNADDRTAINLEILSKHSQGNMAFSLALLQELEDSAESHLETIRSHAAVHNLSAVGESAHSLKGAAAIIGAEHLARIAAEMEEGSSDGNLDRVKFLIEELHLELSKCLEQIPHIRAIGQGTLSGPN